MLAIAELVVLITCSVFQLMLVLLLLSFVFVYLSDCLPEVVN